MLYKLDLHRMPVPMALSALRSTLAELQADVKGAQQKHTSQKAVPEKPIRAASSKRKKGVCSAYWLPQRHS
jgi:hypothetical protein